MIKKMEVIGRQQERDILEQFFQSNSPEFMAIYGRRRVGKTYLVKNYFKKNNVISSKLQAYIKAL